MTIHEAIIGSIYPYAVDEALIRKTCIDEALIEDEAYSSDYKEDVARVTILILRNMISLASESRKDNSLSYNIDALKQRIYDIASQNGLEDMVKDVDARSRITDKSDIW